MSKHVRATRVGLYGHWREEGDVFEVAEDRHFSKTWMEEISAEEAARSQSSETAAAVSLTTAVADNALIEQLRADLAASQAEIARLKQVKQVPEGDVPKTVEEVLAMASDSSIQFLAFKAAAAKLLGDGTPPTKAEIVAALEDLATKP